jgi:uncharacterized protein YaaR (DUF327 family)
MNEEEHFYELPDVVTTAKRLPPAQLTPPPLASAVQADGVLQQPPVQHQLAQGVDLNALMQKYMADLTAQQPNYGEELSAARANTRALQQQFDQTIAKLMEPAESGPSKAEMYFRLAAAFGSPTKTGHFSENLGLAAGEMAGYKKEQREAAKEQRATQQAMQLERLKMLMQGAKDEETTLRTLATEQLKEKRELLKEYIQSGRPQSMAGKTAADMGLQPGTPAYQQKVEELFNVDVQRKNAQLDAIIANMAVQQGQLGIAQQREARMAQQASLLNPKELDLMIETEDALSAAKSAEAALKEALRLNPSTFDASLVDVAQRKALEVVGSSNKQLVNTRNQENLLASQALSQLKSLVGGNPTEGERQIILDLQGVGAKSIKERGIIIKRALETVKARQSAAERRLKMIKSGQLRMTGEQPNE